MGVLQSMSYEEDDTTIDAEEPEVKPSPRTTQQGTKWIPGTSPRANWATNKKSVRLQADIIRREQDIFLGAQMQQKAAVRKSQPADPSSRYYKLV